ncbi:MAG: hypothetical protein JNM36_00995 [Chitinophagales bacterium]|nr:hypothetical protein [Chitinophagales bacterium]
MKKILLIFVFLFSSTTVFCQQYPEIPDEINNAQVNNFEVPGTRISVNKPAHFKYIPELSRLQKETAESENTFIMFMEMNGKHFTKTDIIAHLEAEEKEKGVRFKSFKKSFKLNGYDAVLIYAPQTNGNVRQILLMYGDKDFTVMAAGAAPMNNAKEQKEITDILLSADYIKNKKIDEEQFNLFTIDLKNSKFKFSRNMGGLADYTINGEDSMTDIDKVVECFSVQILPSKLTFNEMKEYADLCIDRMENNTVASQRTIVKSRQANKYQHDGYDVYETQITNEYKGQEHQILIVLKPMGDKTVFFMGIDISGNQLDLYKEIMHTIIPK